MHHRTKYALAVVAAGVVIAGIAGWSARPGAMSTEEAACQALTTIRNLTVISAELRTVDRSSTPYCYATGLIARSIRYHVQLPIRGNWNGRLLKWGDGGKDGTLNFADHRVAQGYAVANSNSGHDSGSEPGAWFGFDNRQAEIDFGYRAVHLTVNAAKTIVNAYYGTPQRFAYFEGCSTGGRQGLMEAQRFPRDFDGIVAGAPVNHYTQANIAEVWNVQRIAPNNFEDGLSFDTDGDGRPDSLLKLRMLHEAVLAKCDGNDGVIDGVVDDPPGCRFDPDLDLAEFMCPGDVNGADCFTSGQVRAIKDFYRGPSDSRGRAVYHGLSPGSEWDWANRYYPSPDNEYRPQHISGDPDHLNFLFYETDPGVPPPDPLDFEYQLRTSGPLPEWAWWQFDVDDFTAGKGKTMMAIMDATDPDLTRFLKDHGGRMILYHGWADSSVPPMGTSAYHDAVVETTFASDMAASREALRLFMLPGMGHCRGGRGPNEWDPLAPLVAWVETGTAPDAIPARHVTDGNVDNERPICARPQRAVYTGPEGGQHDPANWRAGNFSCRDGSEQSP